LKKDPKENLTSSISFMKTKNRFYCSKKKNPGQLAEES
jgi:hypothetical protein